MGFRIGSAFGAVSHGGVDTEAVFKKALGSHETKGAAPHVETPAAHPAGTPIDELPTYSTAGSRAPSYSESGLHYTPSLSTLSKSLEQLEGKQVKTTSRSLKARLGLTRFSKKSKVSETVAKPAPVKISAEQKAAAVAEVKASATNGRILTTAEQVKLLHSVGIDPKKNGFALAGHQSIGTYDSLFGVPETKQLGAVAQWAGGKVINQLDKRLAGKPLVTPEQVNASLPPWMSVGNKVDW